MSIRHVIDASSERDLSGYECSPDIASFSEPTLSLLLTLQSPMMLQSPSDAKAGEDRNARFFTDYNAAVMDDISQATAITPRLKLTTLSCVFFSSIR
jgi:hypothetical protein